MDRTVNGANLPPEDSKATDDDSSTEAGPIKNDFNLKPVGSI
jgi:hypothetical protein